MKFLIDYFLLVTDKIVTILDTLKFPGSSSLLYYMLGAIILGFVFRLVKGSANEFEHGMNFTSGYVVQNAASKYAKGSQKRKEQIVEVKQKENYKDNTVVRINPIHKDLYGGKTSMSLNEMLDYDKKRNM